MNREMEEGVSAVRGIMAALAISLTFWALIAAAALVAWWVIF